MHSTETRNTVQHDGMCCEMLEMLVSLHSPACLFPCTALHACLHAQH